MSAISNLLYARVQSFFLFIYSLVDLLQAEAWSG